MKTLRVLQLYAVTIKMARELIEWKTLISTKALKTALTRISELVRTRKMLKPNLSLTKNILRNSME
jgi:hypothetical protein